MIQTDVKTVRAAIGVAIPTLQLDTVNILKQVNGYLAARNDILSDSDFQTLRNWPGIGTAITELHEATSDEPVYEAAVSLFAQSVAAPATVPVPPPPPVPVVDVPQVPAPPIDGSLRSALEAMGFEFAPNGQISGFLFSSQSGEGEVPGYVGMNDGGLRHFSNIARKIGQPWPNVNKNPNLPTIMGWVTERDGGMSCDYEPPLLASDPNPRPNKTLVMYLAGFIRGIGPRGKANVGKFLDFCSFEAGRGWRFNTRRTGSGTPDIDTALQLDADNGDAVAIRVGGRLRRISVDEGTGMLYASAVVDESQ